MRKSILPLTVGALLLVASGSASAENVKIGIVDMKRVFEGYSKTKESMPRVDELRSAYSRLVGEREKKLNEWSVRMRNVIVEEIMKVVTDKAQGDGYDIVFDRSGVNSNNAPVVLYAKETYDFSNEVLETLNKNRPASSEAAPSAAGEKQEEPAKTGTPRNRP
jgi:Skp family chaperone for outer membrane proteins